jgi:hypothetical protein
VSKTTICASLAATVLYELAHLSLEKTGCLSQFRLTMRKAAIGIVANSIPNYPATHARVCQIGLLFDLRRVMRKCALAALLALPLFKKLAHLCFGELHMVLLLDLGP